MRSLLHELNRRNVLRVGVAYIVSSWLLIQVAETIFPLFGFGDEPARLVVIILAIGFIPALIVSWVFELTPDGLKRDREVDKAQSIAPQTGKKLDRMIMIVLALALTYFAFDKFVLDPERDSQMTESATRAGAEQAMEAARLDMFDEKSVAVLPFVNRSESADDAFFTDGMHDELLTRLTKIASLKVISRTSVMRYRDTLLSIPQIAKELSVAAILEGGVQRSGNKVRINVQLINAKTDEHLWAEIYDRDLTVENVFAIQSEISSNIAQALNATLSPEERTRIYDLPTDSLEANNHYMLGRQLMAARQTAELNQALKEFEAAVELDPEFALAWVGIADTIRLLQDTGNLSIVDVHEQVLPPIEKALGIDDQLGEAYISLGLYLFESYDDKSKLEKSAAAFQKGIELAPSYAQAYHWYALTHFGVERLSRKIGLLYKAAQLDPVSAVIQFNLAMSLGRAGRHAETLEQFDRLLKLHPEYAQAYWGAGILQVNNGNIAEGILSHRKALQLDPKNTQMMNYLAKAYLSIEELESVKAVRQLITDTTGPMSDWGLDLDYHSLLSNNDMPLVLELLSKLPPAILNLPLVLGYAVQGYLQADMFVEARQYAIRLYPFLTDADQSGKLHETIPVVDGCTLAGILINTGDQALGQQLLRETVHYQETILPTLVEDAHADPTLAVCYLLAGEYEKAFDFYTARAEHGHIADWNLNRHWPWWDPVHEDPRFIALNSMIEEMLAEQHELLLQNDAGVALQTGSQ